MSLKFGFKSLCRVQLSDVIRKVIPEEGGMIRKDSAGRRLLFNSGPEGLRFASGGHGMEYKV